MSDEIVTENAESETTAEKSNMSPSEFIQKRMGSLSQTEETQSEEETPSAEEESGQEAEVEETEAEESSEESKDDVLSQLNLDSMSEEQLKLLSEKLGSRAVSRFGELTAKRKAAEERLVALEEKFNDRNPLEDIKKSPNNPYSEINNIDDLKGKAQEVNNVIEWAEDVLFNSDGYSPEDKVAEVEGKPITKAEVRTSLLNARKSRDRFLPDQLAEIQRIETAKVAKESFNRQAKKELSWMDGDDNDTRKQYEAMINDPRFAEIENNVDPEIASQLNYIMAHAANSIYGRKTIKEGISSPKLNPPKTGISSAGTPEKTATKNVKVMKEISQRFRTSGAKNDFVTLRTLQLKNR